METLIIDEAKELIDGFKKEGGKAFDPTRRFSLAVLNSLWIIVTGTRFSQDDDTVTKIIENYFKLVGVFMYIRRYIANVY